jgi:hypothetical protein
MCKAGNAIRSREEIDYFLFRLEFFENLPSSDCLSEWLSRLLLKRTIDLKAIHVSRMP